VTQSMICQWLIFSFFYISYSHICLLYPQQSGPTGDMNKVDASICNYVTKGPPDRVSCTHNPSAPAIYLDPSTTSLNVIFQKNVNHYNASQSGTQAYFEVTWIIENQVSNSYKFNDTNSASLSLIYVKLPITYTKSSTAYVHILYYAPYGNEIFVYHQCSNLVLFGVPVEKQLTGGQIFGILFGYFIVILATAGVTILIYTYKQQIIPESMRSLIGQKNDNENQ